MTYIASWFPFTVDELAFAFQASGDSAEAARAQAQELAEAWDDTGRDEGWYGFSLNFLQFVEPIATLSEDAARRVAEFQRTHRNARNDGQ